MKKTNLVADYIKNHKLFKENEIRYNVLSVGNGEFTYVQVGNKAVVIDAGRGRSGKVDETDVKSKPIKETKESKENIRSLDEQYAYNLAADFQKAFNKVQHLHDQDKPSENRVWDDTDVGWDFVANEFKKNNVEVIEAIFISHAHQDHTWLVSSLIQHMPVNNIVMPATNYKLTAQKLQEVLEFKGTIWTQFQPVYNFLGIEFENLSSYVDLADLEEAGDDNPNNSSAIFRFSMFGKTVLFTGDADIEEIQLTGGILLKKISEKPIDLFVLPHHGSINSSVGPILDIIGSGLKYAVISGTGSNAKWKEFSGGFKFPNPQTIVFIRHKAPQAEVFVTGSLPNEPLKNDPKFYRQVSESEHSYAYVVKRHGSKKDYHYTDQMVINPNTIVKFKHKS